MSSLHSIKQYQSHRDERRICNEKKKIEETSNDIFCERERERKRKECKKLSFSPKAKPKRRKKKLCKLTYQL